jgi:hypothetical protein
VSRAATCLLATFGWVACTSEGPAETRPLLACVSVASFGNGASCSDDDSSLKSCGASPWRACASSWLCFDDARYDQCTCATDADCAGRLAYINDARAANGKAPIASKCEEGRCAGRP